MSEHFTWTSGLPALIHDNQRLFGYTEKFILGIFLGLIIILVGRKATSKIRATKDLSGLVIPEDKLTLANFFDIFVDGIAKYQDSVLGKENRKYLPLTASIFTFILCANLIGLVPGVAAITTTVWINVGMALVVFIAFNYYGIKENGLVGYLSHFCGPILIMSPFIFVLEMFSTFLRIITLNMRLYWNITADHMVLETFTEMTKIVIPVIFYVLGAFVCFMQAFIFTTLTMVYILLATQHEEEHH